MDVIVEACWDGDRLVPFRDRSRAIEAMPILGEFFPTYADYARAGLYDLYPEELLAETLRLELHELRSGVWRNDGAGAFTFEALPRIAQCAPGRGVVLTELDGDGLPDLFLAQNDFSPQPETGRFDGGVGQVLMGTGDGWRVVEPWVSGVAVRGAGAGLAATDFDGDGHVDLVMGVNDGPLRAFYNLRTAGGRTLVVELAGPAGNPTAVGAHVTLTTNDGASRSGRVGAGGGWLSQSMARLVFGLGRATGQGELRVRWPDGGETSHVVPLTAGRVRLPRR